MLRDFFPYEYVEGVLFIDYKKLYDRGYRGIIFDIDNTLVPHGKDSNEKIDGLFKYIQELGFKTILLSNNSEERVKRFLQNIDSLYICDAEKPKIDGYLKAVDMLGLDKEQVVFIGDQIFTDIYGANKSNLANILVKYIGYDTEKKIGIKRNIEKLVLKVYNLNESYQNRIGNVEIKEVS